MAYERRMEPRISPAALTSAFRRSTSRSGGYWTEPGCEPAPSVKTTTMNLLACLAGLSDQTAKT